MLPASCCVLRLPVYDGHDITNEIVSGDSGYQQSIDFRRIPDCYFDELEDWIKPSTAYVANNTATKSLQWLVNDSSGHSHCDDTFLLERFALSAMNFAAPIKADTNAIADTLWISTQQHCSWETITCEGGYVKGLSVRRKGLSGTIPTSIGLLTGLQAMEYGACQLIISCRPLPATWYHNLVCLIFQRLTYLAATLDRQKWSLGHHFKQDWAADQHH